jgi:hypothetical protein
MLMGDKKIYGINMTWRGVDSYDTLDHIWRMRETCEKTGECSLETSESFRYLEKYRDVFNRDDSLRVVTSLCSCRHLSSTVRGTDVEVEKLSRLFNEIAHSGRKLHRCYDCGTVARAVFLALIRSRRGHLQLSATETERIPRMYSPDKEDPAGNAIKCRDFLKAVRRDTVFICSLGLGDMGHVWTIEKINSAGEDGDRVRIQYYQSSFRSHMLIDFVRDMDYGRNPSQSMDVDGFFSDLCDILQERGKWGHSLYEKFARRFRFLFSTEITDPEPSFCWTYVTYDE